jgi:thiamine-phosphate pyrophosphorylase
LKLSLGRLYPILDTDVVQSRGLSLETAAAEMLDAGVRVLHIRHKAAWNRELLLEAERIARLYEQRHALLIIDDRADIARLLGAGLHVGQDDLPPADARRLIGPDPVLGYSTHNAEQLMAAAAEPVDYVALGPMFATQSKANPDPVVGVERLRSLRRLTGHPLVAIGGITRGNAMEVFEAGADSVAVIGDALPSEGSISKRMDEWRRAIGRL